ncbi:NAD-dependent epimerase/dehydratase family protein [Flavisphingomonas formosensis]|uniref:NAD-dependent epimerase/dehydratase family protein n=1 Tax=Flavisphingomonas formosensis TaxID=861534 RepID=UPI0012FAAC59|nr:NAD(P)-dependent oxidoreductase [Sphingomonas formosensis]
MAGAARILITGGTGFIGSHLVRRCVAEGHEVHVLLRPSSAAVRLEPIGSAVTLHRLSLSDGAAVRACLAAVRPTGIFHLVGNTASRHDPTLAQSRESLESLTDFLSLVEAAAGMEVPPRLFLRTGSIAEYGAAALPFYEEQRERPETGYAASLVAATHYAQAIAPRLPFPLVTARLALVYGPGQASDFLVPSIIEACVANRPISLRRPKDRRDLIHVDDVVEVLTGLAREMPADCPVINIGSGYDVSVEALAETIADLAGCSLRLLAGGDDYEPVTLRLSIERLRRATGWRPRVPLREGLAALIEEARPRMMTVAA